VAGRSDYPQQCGTLPSQATDEQVISLAREVLVKRKGQEGFAPLLIAECDCGQLPATLARLLLDIDAQLSADLTIPSDGGALELDAVTGDQVAGGSQDAGGPVA
jgi:putative ATP-dependent endonuclease of OLD family